MIAPVRPPKRQYTDQEVNAKFLELMPHVQKTAQISFSVYDAERREEAVQSVLVTAFQLLRQLAEQGRLEDAYATPLAKYSIARFREGRPGGVSSCSNDVTSERCRWLGRSKVKNYGLAENIADSFESEATAADARYPIHRTVQLRIDFFETWFRQQPHRDRQIIRDLAMGETTGDVAKKYGVSPALISQYRRRYADSWYAFINPPEEMDLVDELREAAEAA